MLQNMSIECEKTRITSPTSLQRTVKGNFFFVQKTEMLHQVYITESNWYRAYVTIKGKQVIVV